MIGVPVRIVQRASLVTADLSDVDRIALAVEITRQITAPKMAGELEIASVRVADRSRMLANIGTPPSVGHAPIGGVGLRTRQPKARFWGRLLRVARWLEDSWAGELLGALCIFGMVYLFLLFALVAN